MSTHEEPTTSAADLERAPEAVEGQDPDTGPMVDPDERADEWGDESFPASDPPAQTPGVER